MRSTRPPWLLTGSVRRGGRRRHAGQRRRRGSRQRSRNASGALAVPTAAAPSTHRAAYKTEAALLPAWLVLILAV